MHLKLLFLKTAELQLKKNGIFEKNCCCFKSTVRPFAETAKLSSTNAYEYAFDAFIADEHHDRSMVTQRIHETKKMAQSPWRHRRTSPPPLPPPAPTGEKNIV